MGFNKNERINIRPLMNGYLVEYEYRTLNPTSEDPGNWSYNEEQFMFSTWDEIVDWVSKNKLTVPPAKIGG